MKSKTTLLVIAIILILVAAAYTTHKLYKEEQQGPVTYKTEKPTRDDIIKKSVANGAVVPRKEILIKPQVSGIIKEIYVKAGDIVKDGDKIAKVKVIPDMVSLSNAENRLERANLALNNANQDYERNSQLLKEGVIAPATFQAFEMSRQQALTEVSGATDNLQIIRDGVSRSGGGSSNTVIRSTIDGMVLDVPVEQGNSVIEANTFNEGTTICEVADMDDLIFEGQVDESEVEKLQDGMDLILTLGAIENKKFDAQLEYISPKGVEDNGAIQFDIEAAVKLNDEDFIRAGYSANADVVLERRIDVLTISESLVQYEDDKPFIEVKTGESSYEKRDVELGLSDGLRVELLSGVGEDEEIKVWNRPITE